MAAIWDLVLVFWNKFFLVLFQFLTGLSKKQKQKKKYSLLSN